MIVCVAVTPDGMVGGGWGRAPRVAIAKIEAGRIAVWDEYPVGWDVLHDVGTEGGHHGRIATFLKEHDVAVVVAGHMGPPMVQMLGKMRIIVRTGVAGDARAAAEAAARLDA